MRRRDDERGAAAIFLALFTCFVLLPITALAVDTGLQRIGRRDAQSIADVAAQDAARALGTGTTNPQALLTIARQTAAAQPIYVGKSTPTVDLHVGTLDRKNFVSDQSLGCGGSSVYNSYFTQTPTGQVPDAVVVTVSNSVGFQFYGGSGGVCRSSIAQAYKTACMTMDSYAAALRSNQGSVLGVLNSLLGTNINANVLSGSGILTTDLNVLSFLNVLKTQLNLGSVDQVLAANVTAAQVLQAQATALTQQGAASTAISALNSQITGNLGPLANQQPGINIGELVGITQGGASALGTSVNAFDLAAAAVQLANGTNPVAATIALPAGLTGATSVGVTVGTRPQRVCLGDGRKSVGQTSATVTASIASQGSLVANLVTGLTGVVNGVLCGVVGAVLGADCFGVPTVSLGGVSVTASLASASGEVLRLNCTGATPNSMDITEAASLAPAGFTVPLTITQTRTYGPITNRRTETVTSTLTIRGVTDSRNKTVPDTLQLPADYDAGKAGPSGDLSVPGLVLSSTLESDGKFTNASGTSLLGGLVGGVDGAINLIAGQLLTPLLSLVADPLVSALTTALRNLVGLTIAGSTYTPQKFPSCGTPSLAG